MSWQVVGPSGDMFDEWKWLTCFLILYTVLRIIKYTNKVCKYVNTVVYINAVYKYSLSVYIYISVVGSVGNLSF